MKSGDAARLMGWDTTRLSRVERGLYRISAAEVRDLCGHYGVDDTEAVEEIAKVAEQPPGAGWWAPYSGRINGAYLDFIELEASADTIRIAEPVVIPGLLQSPGYVREMITRAPLAVSEERAEMLVNIRLARQSVLSRTERPVRVHALVPETALNARFAAGQSIMRDQIRKLLDASSSPNVTLQIVPLAAHPTFLANGAMTLMGFRHPWTPVVSADNPMGGTHTEEPDQVAYLEKVFTGVHSIALPVDESRELLNRYLEGTNA